MCLLILLRSATYEPLIWRSGWWLNCQKLSSVDLHARFCLSNFYYVLSFSATVSSMFFRVVLVLLQASWETNQGFDQQCAFCFCVCLSLDHIAIDVHWRSFCNYCNIVAQAMEMFACCTGNLLFSFCISVFHSDLKKPIPLIFSPQ